MTIYSSDIIDTGWVVKNVGILYSLYKSYDLLSWFKGLEAFIYSETIHIECLLYGECFWGTGGLMEPHSSEGDNPEDVRPVIALVDNTTELIYSSFRFCDNRNAL